MARNNRRRRRNRQQNRSFNKLGRDFAKAETVASNGFDLSPLDRVDASRPTEVSNLLNQHQALSDPFSQAYAGKRTGEMQDYIGRLKGYTEGYDAQELNALREQRRRQTERGFQGGRESLMRGQGATSAPRQARGAQLLELAKSYGQSSADAENDLFVEGAQVKRDALDKYGTAVGTEEANEFDRSQQALKNYTDILGTTRADELEREKINLGQQAADRAAKSGATLGVLEIQRARQNARQQNKLIREGYKSNERIAGRSQPSTGGTNGYADALNALADELGGQ